jgi:uncharacterized protein (TIGR00299 family) protein
MRVLLYDCFSGISGDMNLAAMLALGVDESLLRTELAKLKLNDEFDLKITPDSKCGIHGLRVDVDVTHHCHDHDATEGHEHHRHLADIETLICDSDLSETVKTTSIAIFRRIAIAEAHVHNTTIDAVHFHEVGAVDAIVDIVGAAVCRDALGVDTVLSTPVQLGGGTVKCAHGVLPVPAPATVEILKGIPTRRGAVQHETTTPTGAAILAELVDTFTDTPGLISETCAYGIGHRNMEIPNVLRVQLGTETSLPNEEDAILLECAIDDMTAEALSYAMERLFAAGAADINLVPATMKKSRPGTILSVLCSPGNEVVIKKAIFRETSTLGIKRIPVGKTILERRTRRCETPLGDVTIKEACLGGRVIRSKPEFEECANLARKHDIPLADVYKAIREHDSTCANTHSGA